MKVISSKPKGQRILKCLTLEHTNHKKEIIKVRRPFWIEPIGKGWWFSITRGQWYDGGYDKNAGQSISSYYSMKSEGLHNIYSLKAAKRLISKWDVPKGTWFRVGLPFAGYDFKIRK